MISTPPALLGCGRAIAEGWKRLALLPPGVLLGSLFATFVALTLWEMHDESITTDELVHLSSGYTYLVRKDFRLNTEHPVLTKAAAALPLLFMNLRCPLESEDWKSAREWQFGFHFLFTSGNPADRMLFWGRITMLVWPLLGIATVYFIARSLYGPSGALASAILAAFLPMFLGHGHLVTTDVPVSVMMLLAAWRFHKLSETPTLKHALACGAMLGIALLVKYSAVLLLPPMLWFLATRWIRRAWSARGSPGAGGLLMRAGLRWTGCLGVVAAVSLLLIWAGYGFRYRAATDPICDLEWRFERTEHSAIGKVLSSTRRLKLLPEAYLHGFWYMFENAQSRTAYACGQRSPVGWWWYFPFAFLVKTPVAGLVLMGAGLWSALGRRRLTSASTDFLLIPVIMYWVIAAAGNIMIGLRHMMPVFPMMIVLAGAVSSGTGPEEPSPARRVWTVGILLGLVVEVLLAGPYYLAYFNGPATLAAPRHWMLTDSNLDWGQDLARLKKWMDREGIPRIKLAYFGNDSSRYRGLQHDRLMAANMYQQYEPEWKEAGILEGGDWIAVSATNYSGVVLGENYDWYRLRLGDLKPTTTIGHSILIYHLPERWAPPLNLPR